MWNATGQSRGYPDVATLAGLPAEGGKHPVHPDLIRPDLTLTRSDLT